LHKKINTVYILGAGFSCYAALPTQQEIVRQLFNHQELSGPPDINEILTAIIRDFLASVFQVRSLDEHAPTLEDIYTCIDLSAQTGHFLGQAYTPKKLQAIRQLLTHRIFQILEKRYQPSPAISQLLEHVLQKENSAFISLNWDMVLEKHLAQLSCRPDYQCSIQPLTDFAADNQRIPVCKLHGSANWAYCDNCKYLFFDPDTQTALHDQLFLFPHDFSLFGYTPPAASFSSLACPHCRIPHLSTHIVTFSFRKNFRTNYFSCLWHQAEMLLQQADRWVFIGYSLPQADYQFKHLLKSAQLIMGESHLPELTVITKNNGRELSPSVVRYLRFFGDCMSRRNIYQHGIDEYVANHYHLPAAPPSV